MGEKEIKEEYEHFKRDIQRMADEEIQKIKNKIRHLEKEAQEIGKETEHLLDNNPKAKKKANKN